MTHTRDIQSYLIKSINNHFVSISVIVVVTFVIAQFFVLATVGTKGAEIAAMRNEMQQLRIDNEYLRAEIDESKTRSRIARGLKSVFDLEAKQVDTIHVSGNSDTLGVAGVTN